MEYIENGEMIHFVRGYIPPDIKRNLPAGNYTLCQNDKGQFFLIKKDPFKEPKVIYGDYGKLAKRYLNTFKDRPRSTGVLLCGTKGTGKTLLAQKICIESNLPTIFINTDFSGDSFLDFMSSIDQECIFFIDEFDKVYKEEKDSNSLLGILDGNFTRKHMFLFTSNKQDMNKFLENRPSRVFYKKVFHGLTQEVITQVIDNELINKEHKDSLIDLCSDIGEVNMDILRSIIEEMNRYNESPKEVIPHLNINQEVSNFSCLVSYKDDSKVWIPKVTSYQVGSKSNFYLEVDYIENDNKPKSKKKVKPEEKYEYFHVKPENLKEKFLDKYIYEDEQMIVRFTKLKPIHFYAG